MTDTFITIESPSEAVFTEKRSKFLAFAYPVKTAREALDIVASLEKKYFDARHVCWAYMLGFDRDNFRANDNGEPSGTAGRPILGQINSFGLTDVLVAVVRYFGGVKLGTPGLIVAYRTAARMALEAATIVTRHITATVSFTYPYQVINDVMKVTRADGVRVVESTFDNTCAMTLEVNLDSMPRCMSAFENIDGLTLCNQPNNESINEQTS